MGEKSQDQEAKQSLTLWLCQKESPYWNIRDFLMMTSEIGDDNPQTSRRGRYIYIFPPSAPRAKNSGNNRSKIRIHRNSEKNIQCNAALYIRTPWGDQRNTKNFAGNVNTRPRSGRNGTSQCSTYYLKLSGNGTVHTYDYDHEIHAGETKKTRLSTELPN